MTKLLAISDTYIPSALMQQGFGPLTELGVAVEVRRGSIPRWSISSRPIWRSSKGGRRRCRCRLG